MDGLDPAATMVSILAPGTGFCTPRPCINIGPEFSGEIGHGTQSNPGVQSSDIPQQRGERQNESDAPQKAGSLFARGCGGRRVLYPGGQGQVDRALATGFPLPLTTILKISSIS